MISLGFNNEFVNPVKEINKEIARTEGYLHEDILKEELYAIYDDELKDSTLLYYIQFEFIPLEQEDDTDESAE